MDKYENDFPENHQYKRYLGEKKGDLRREGVHGENFGRCLEETREEAELPERILKSTR